MATERKGDVVLRLQGDLYKLMKASTLLPAFSILVVSPFTLKVSTDRVLAPRRNPFSVLFSIVDDIDAGSPAARKLSLCAWACRPTVR